MDKNLLVATITALSNPTRCIVSSKELKREFNQRGVSWGYPHGWPIRDAEDDEMSSRAPRIVKWRLGRGERGMIGYSLVGDAAAEALAVRRGFFRLRN